MTKFKMEDFEGLYSYDPVSNVTYTPTSEVVAQKANFVLRQNLSKDEKQTVGVTMDKKQIEDILLKELRATLEGLQKCIISGGAREADIAYWNGQVAALLRLEEKLRGGNPKVFLD